MFSNIPNAPSSPSGLGRTLWFVERDKVTLAGKPTPVDPLNPTDDELICINDDHTFADAADGWKSMAINCKDATFNMSPLENENFDHTAFVPYDAITTQIVAFLKRKPDLIVLISANDCDAEEWWQLGDNCAEVEITADVNFGSKGDDTTKRRTGITFNSKMGCPCRYKGAITPQP